jgi:ectoine hydroxylase
MELTAEQLARYQEDGFLIFPELFSPEEVAILRGEVDRVSKIDSSCIVREEKDGPAKTIFRMHEEDGATASPAVRAAARSPRALRVAQQILGDDALYMHHCKVNVKAAIQGSAWPWHQDFGSWHLDGIAEPHLTTMMVMLDEATEFNGCLYLLPKSHRDGRHNPYWDDSTAYSLWSVGPSKMREMIARYPDPVPLVGKPGTAAIFHCNNLHASGHNLSAGDRCQMYFCFNTVENRPADVDNPRPDYVRSRNWEPMTLEPDDGVLRTAMAPTG